MHRQQAHQQVPQIMIIRKAKVLPLVLLELYLCFCKCINEQTSEYMDSRWRYSAGVDQASTIFIHKSYNQMVTNVNGYTDRQTDNKWMDSQQINILIKNQMKKIKWMDRYINSQRQSDKYKIFLLFQSVGGFYCLLCGRCNYFK